MESKTTDTFSWRFLRLVFRCKLDDWKFWYLLRARWTMPNTVAPGITAPSGVLMVGAALVLRDLVQRSLGFKWALGAVLVGAALSGLVATQALVIVHTMLSTL